MTPLEEMQFELLPREDALAGMPFGIHLPVSVDEEGFFPGDDEWAVQDVVDSRSGAVAMGRDALAGPLWAWNLHVDQEDVASARNTLSAFRTAWRAQEIAETPGAFTAIRYRLDGEYRRIFGRPRRLAAPPTNRILSGYVPITVDFQASDAFVYSDEQRSTSLMVSASTSNGGFMFPTVFPTTTVPPNEETSATIVGGDARTYPTLHFEGPFENPEVITDRWRFQLRYNIPAGSYVDVDLRPWVRTALLNGVTSVAGGIAPRTNLSEIYLEPGPLEITVGGSAFGGAGRCEVRWRDAWNSY